MDNRQLSNTIEISTDIGTYTYDINAVNAINAENAQKLGGVAASSYAKKSDLSGIPNQTVTANGVTFGDNVAVEFVGDGATSITSSGDSNQIKISSTDTKVTSVDNHYSPTEDTVQELSVDANSSTSATWGTTDLVTGINIKRDAKGHVTGVTVDSVQMPANPDTHNSHTIISGKKSDGTTDIKSTASSGDITLGDSGVTAGEYGPTSNQTPNYGATFNVPDIKVNSKGIVTAISNKTVKIPASDNSESTITVTANTNTPLETNLAYAITALTPEGTAGHTIKPTYTEFPTKKYVDDTVAGAAFGETQLGLIQEQINNSIGNGTLTIKKKGTTAGTFTANSKNDVEVDIEDTNTTYDLVAPASKTNGNVTINLTAGGSGSGTDSVTVKGTGTTTVTTDADGIITINSTTLSVDTALSSSSTNPVQNKVVHSALAAKLDTTLKGAVNGLAELDANGKVLSSQLPSYVDDVIEGTFVSDTSFKNTSGTTITGETSKIYVDTTTNKTYRWSGSKYVEISPSIALGETSATAYRGDRGKTAYDHSQAAHAPSNAQKNSNITKAEIEAKLIGTITSHTHSYASLISHGTADPTASTQSQYYFKIN